MDSRTALNANTILRFSDGYEFTVADELARGGTSIVYNAFYIDNLGQQKTVYIKECYPFKCNLKRSPNGELLISKSEEPLFLETKEKFLQAYRLGNDFFYSDGLTNLTTNTYNLFYGNNTVYIVLAYVQGQKLSYNRYTQAKDCIAVTKSVATAIQKLHRKGFLYLDIKPDNILTLEGTTELIHLFDFDTVVSMTNIAGTDDRISFTRGFAAPELQSGRSRYIGPHTDVYGIGALLFYLLFNRIPDVFDCEIDAEYDFSNSKLSGGCYQDTLIFRLTDFFHHTLSNYYLDRFSNMETVAEKLTELQSLADLCAHYIVDSKVYRPTLFLGRSPELEWLTTRLIGNSTGCYFVTGMGGIGKSTLVHQAIHLCTKNIDTLLYLNFHSSLKKTICDDYAAQIHGIQKDKRETDGDYFLRKLSILREMGKDKNCILVLDNFVGSFDEDFAKLQQIGWKIVFVTRETKPSQGYESLMVAPFSEKQDLLNLFSKNLGQDLDECSVSDAMEIISAVGAHTLLVELIAKQIGHPVSGMAMDKAAKIVKKYGFSSISETTVSYQKDNAISQQTVKQIISGLFDTDVRTEAQRTLLKTLSLFGQNGVSVDQICEMLELNNRENIQMLYQQGWISVTDAQIILHPVIAEVAANWELTENAKKAAFQVLQYLDIKLRMETQKEEYPKHLLDSTGRLLVLPQEWLKGKILQKIENSNANDVYFSRIAYHSESSAADHKAMTHYLRLAMAVLENGSRIEEIQQSDIYLELLYYVILITPYEQESYLIEKCEELILLSRQGNEAKLLKINEILLEILYEQGQLQEAQTKIRQVWMKISGNCKPNIWGRYYYLLAGFYDYLLNGGYDAVTEEEFTYLHALLRAVNKAIHWFALSTATDSGLMLGECYRLKALVLTRSSIGKKKQVSSLLNKVHNLTEKYARPNSKLVRDYNMTMAWYYTYLEEDYDRVHNYLYNAYEITDITVTSELAKIDEQLCPMANIMLEWQKFDEAASYLIQCILICEKYPAIIAYARREIELLEHLLQVYTYSNQPDKCRAVLERLEEKTAAFTRIHAVDCQL